MNDDSIPNPPDLVVVTLPRAAVAKAASMLAALSAMPEGTVVTPEMQHDAATVARHLAPSVLGHAYRWEWHLVVEPIDVDPEAD